MHIISDRSPFRWYFTSWIKKNYISLCLSSKGDDEMCKGRYKYVRMFEENLLLKVSNSDWSFFLAFKCQFVNIFYRLFCFGSFGIQSWSRIITFLKKFYNYLKKANEKEAKTPFCKLNMWYKSLLYIIISFHKLFTHDCVINLHLFQLFHQIALAFK